MKKKALLSSLLVIVLCMSLITGATFALFTDKAEVNVAITAGTVSVDAKITDLKTYSFDVEQAAGKFENGGTAVLTNEDKLLTLDLMSPGDKATLTVDVTNSSNINVKYRVAAIMNGDLAPALKATATMDGKEYTVAGTRTKWVEVAANQAISDITVAIEFPDAENNNDFMGKSASISISVEAVQANGDTASKWNGTSDTSWYWDDPTATEFALDNSAQLAGLAELIDAGTDTFEDKTVKLECDMDLYYEDANGDLVCFEPIGSYRNDQAFKGTFDGQGFTVSSMSQNTWALDNGYYYGDLGIGFFGLVEDAQIKNLNFDGVSISGESGLCGVVAGAAYGDCTFENITVSNAKCNDYQYYAGGIVGWASGDHKYINCDVDASTTIGGQWGDFGNASGGIIGGAGTSATIYLEDCDIACRIDAVNDVVSTYHWYAYRNSGMIIGKTGHYELRAGETSVGDATAPQLTCKNVTVTYGDWANYTYCAFGTGIYAYVRAQAGVSVDAYSNVRYGHPTDANGNTVVDDNHVHNAGEDHHILLRFDQLYGGAIGDNSRGCVYGTATHEGVTVIYNNK